MNRLLSLFRSKKQRCPNCGQRKTVDMHFSFGTETCNECLTELNLWALECIGTLCVYAFHPNDPELPKADLQNILDEATRYTRLLPVFSLRRPHMLDTLVTLGQKLGLDTSKVVW